MDDEQKKEQSFEEQLAELIKQSGGDVPPKKARPQEAPQETPRPQDEGDFVVENEPQKPRTKTPEEIEAEIEAMITATESGSAAFVMPEDGKTADFVMPDEPQKNDFVIPEEQQNGFVMPESGGAADFVMPEQNTNNAFVMPEQNSSADFVIPEEPQKNDFVIPEEQQNGFVMPESGGGAADFVMPEQNPNNAFVMPEQNAAADSDDGLGNILAQIEELENAIAADNERSEKERIARQAERKAAENDILDGKLNELLKNLEEKNESAPEEEVVPKEDIEIVPRPRAKESAPYETPPASAPPTDNGMISEIEQLRAKVATLEYLLSQKSEEKHEAPRPKHKEREQPSAPVSPPPPSAIPGDINSMFKQWFDLEMAAKMKNLITDEEKQSGKPRPDKPAAYDPMQPRTETDVPSDMIKLSDNVFYSVRDKKTYTLRELTPTLPSGQKSAPRKKKAPPKRPTRRKTRPRRRGMRRPRRRPLHRPPKP